MFSNVPSSFINIPKANYPKYPSTKEKLIYFPEYVEQDSSQQQYWINLYISIYKPQYQSIGQKHH